MEGSATADLKTYLMLTLLLPFPKSRSRYIDRNHIFFPSRELLGTPADMGLQYDEAYFPTSDGLVLHGWFVPGEAGSTLLWFHGNSGNISYHLENLDLLHRHLRSNIFIFDYRGYGRSQGQPTEEGIYRDSRAALAYLQRRREVNGSLVVYAGHSLGSAVAVELATQHPPAGMILEAPITSIRDMAKVGRRWLPAGLLVNNKFNSLQRMKRVKVPLLVIHGDRDPLVPYELGIRLFQAAPGPKWLYTVEGADHKNASKVGGEQYFSTLRQFLRVLGSGAFPERGVLT